MNPKPQLNVELLRSRLKLKNFAAERKLLASHATAAKFFRKVGLRPGEIRQHAAKLLTSGALASSLLISAHTSAPSAPTGVQPTAYAVSVATPVFLEHDLALALQAILPPADHWQLTPDQENEISKKLNNLLGLNAKAELEGHRLNNDYGRMGAEQHLPRYPGDTVYQHEAYIDKGITPGLGGWGYFAYSPSQLTPELENTERYYVAVQTLYLPNWLTDTAQLAAWYKYRRVVVVNPANGKVVVAAVADAGPAIWTGKHFGGSPEVMAYLGINYGQQNHPVVLFFLDDPDHKVPLGPVEYNVVTGNPALAYKT